MAHPGLTLPGDTQPQGQRLSAFLEDWAQANERRTALAGIVLAIAQAAPAVAKRLARGALTGDPTRVLGTNMAGDAQKALDMAAHDHFLASLSDQAVACVLSEEADEIVPMRPAAPYALAMDPIDGSGSIGIGALLGTLFAIYPATTDPLKSFSQTGRSVVAAGYLSFGHSLDFGFSLGEGVMLATYYPATEDFYVTDTQVRIPSKTSMIAYNAANQRHWSEELRHYIADCRAGAVGPRGHDMNMRWLAAAVGDVHRIMHRGGVFMYPWDNRPGYGQGRLRLLYEAVPIAFLMEQAGGAATDGQVPILDKQPDTLHGFTSLFFGSADEIAVIADYLKFEGQRS